MKLTQRTIKNYAPYYIGIGIFCLIFGLAMQRPFMWIIGLVFLVLGPVKARIQKKEVQSKEKGNKKV